MKQATLIAASAVVALSAASMATASTLDDVKGKGFVQCGVNGVLPGFSTTDDKGNWAGLDLDYCRALATATLGDPKKRSEEHTSELQSLMRDAYAVFC